MIFLQPGHTCFQFQTPKQYETGEVYPCQVLEKKHVEALTPSSDFQPGGFPQSHFEVYAKQHQLLLHRDDVQVRVSGKLAMHAS